MVKYLVGIYYSLPVQLFLLHFRKYQVFLVFWYILFSTVDGTFMKSYGANSLFLGPEYLGSVNALSAGMVGFTIAVFIMSWNITTFILHGRHLRFLATTSNPFLKYCINNAVTPVLFLLFYLFKAITFNSHQELMPTLQIMILVAGFITGFVLSLAISFLYFFRADKSIYKRHAVIIDTANVHYALATKDNPLPPYKGIMRIDWFLSARLKLRKPRDVRHYSQEFLESIFKRHHIAAVLSIFFAFLFLVLVGFYLDKPIFQVPAAASITIFFAILISVAGAFSLFLRNWSVPVLLFLYLLVNYLYEHDIIDTRNKAYGLDYTHSGKRPVYNRETLRALAGDSNAQVDKRAYIAILEKWKARQPPGSKVMYLVNVSGGGTRSSTFVMNVLQRLDSATQGSFMKQTVLINGSSGGMLAAAYFRELYLRKQQGLPVNLQDHHYRDNISRDLLNPLFSSFVARDLTAPAQHFRVGNYQYVKDRGYAFEEKYNDNIGGVLNKRLSDYYAPESEAAIPLIFFNSVISRDGRKLLISTHPARFIMKTSSDSTMDPDIIDYVSFFKELDPYNLRVLSALRMNATFPYVLPNVWLPTTPVIDVMDAGLRDNYGMETTLRFISNFSDWLQANDIDVKIVNIRDRQMGDWDKPFESTSVLSWITKPIFLLQSNWFKIQDYYQADQVSYAAQLPALRGKISRINFQYVAQKKDVSASLSFHLTTAEKRDIANALNSPPNMQSLDIIRKYAASK